MKDGMEGLDERWIGWMEDGMEDGMKGCTSTTVRKYRHYTGTVLTSSRTE